MKYLYGTLIICSVAGIMIGIEYTTLWLMFCIPVLFILMFLYAGKGRGV